MLGASSRPSPTASADPLPIRTIERDGERGFAMALAFPERSCFRVPATIKSKP